MPLNRKEIHNTIHFATLLLFVASLPFSRFTLSISILLMGINWITEGGLIRKFKSFFNNRAAVAVGSLYLLHLVGLLYSTDFDYAIIDLQTKLPLLVLPIILSTSDKLSRIKVNSIILIFISAVAVASLICTYRYIFYDIVNFRDAFPFISHIRFSLMVCLSILLLAWNIYSKKINTAYQIILIVTLLWLIFHLFYLKLATGIIILLTCLFISILYIVWQKKNRLLWISTVTVILIISLSFVFVLNNLIRDCYHINMTDTSTLESYTSQGNPYKHNISSKETENGNYTYLYLNQNELKQEWNKISKIKYYEKDKKGQSIRFTLIRYLTSKGLRKDANGMNSLSYNDIISIENGIANYKYNEWNGIYSRMHQIVWAYRNYQTNKNPSGFSIMQRFEFWKASIGIITNNASNLLIGVGTGDMNIAFQNQYSKMNSLLRPEYRWRSHNQYLSIITGFGIIGFVWFLFSLFYAPWKLNTFRSYPYAAFLFIALLSMLTEDTLETQVGVSFIAFFNSFFLFGRKNL